jgi:hypothetical protein
MITVGLDFGTHQSKVCVETNDGVELRYSFFKFRDCSGKAQFTLPSIILEQSNGLLSYGYLPKNSKGNIVRYFKQGTFTKSSNMTKSEAIYYSIWYLAYIFFDLEEEYGQDFAIQMGVPTDGDHFSAQKKLAVSLVLSAYRLVEQVYRNDKKAFLYTRKSDLIRRTEIVPYSKQQKKDYSILVLPEAYACLMPLIHQSKIDNGMSLMVDIGGGTTDISFFSVIRVGNNETMDASERLRLYDFYSINKGLNFLTDADKLNNSRLDSNVDLDGQALKSQCIAVLREEITQIYRGLVAKLEQSMKKQSALPVSELQRILQCRPIIFTGGGSTFPSLRVAYGGFKDIIHVSSKEWRHEVIDDIQRIEELGLCPILSTAYGLSISVLHDDIKCDKFDELFNGIRNYKPDSTLARSPLLRRNNRPIASFDYSLDYDAMK